VVLLLLVPSAYVLAPLGAAGTPAQVFAMAMALWWVGRRLALPFVAGRRSQPVRTAVLVLLGAATASYVAANLRAIEGVEATAADRGMLTLLALLGVVLVAGDQIPSRHRLDVLLRRLVLVGAAVAAFGLLQFVTGSSFLEYLRPPGLVANTDLVGVGERGGFSRPAGTALSPIEFGVAMTMLLPPAVHYALHDGHRGRLVRWVPVALLALAIPVAVSRSAVLGAAVAFALMLPTMSPRARRGAVVAALGMVALVYVAVPGMLGTLLRLFTGIGTDASAESRTSSYGLALEFVSHSPVVGRGFGTFLPEYRILDNQFLLTTIEMGVVGLLALLGLLVTGAVVARRTARAHRGTDTGRLAQALLASLAAGAVSFALFDALSFPIVAGLTFLVLGAIGALHALAPVPQGTRGRGGRDTAVRGT
jgi:O-antigen ligase